MSNILKQYTFHTDYVQNEKLRLAFNRLSEKIFNLSFEEWYQSGYWNEKYIPYTLFDGENAIANVSVNVMDFNYLGQRKRCIQLGTIMTDPAYRKKGLSHYLMNLVLQEWNDKCEFIYLFANSTVLDFYPKFGFIQVTEYEYYKNISNSNGIKHELLDMNISANRAKLHDYAKNSMPISKLSMQENADLIVFYSLGPMTNHVYYLPSLDAIAIANINNNQLHLYDVYAKNEVELEDVIVCLSNPSTTTVVLGFTPKETGIYITRKLITDDALFIQSNKADFFQKDKIMFPLLSHA